jgi:hypothetical protein
MSLCVRAGPPTPKDEAHDQGPDVGLRPGVHRPGIRLAVWSASAPPRTPVSGQPAYDTTCLSIPPPRRHREAQKLPLGALNLTEPLARLSQAIPPGRLVNANSAPLSAPQLCLLAIT